jgi:hypothetical protein
MAALRGASLAAAAVIVLLGGIGAGAARADVVANGGFETGDFTGWTVSDPVGITVDAADPFDGSYDASLGTGGATGTLSQTLRTVAGTTYAVSFELQNQDATLGAIPGFVDLLTVAFGADIGFSSAGVLSGPGYNLISFDAIATAAATSLVFTEENDLSVWNLDDVSVTPLTTVVPEPASGLVLLGAAGFALATSRRRRKE